VLVARGTGNDPGDRDFAHGGVPQLHPPRIVSGAADGGEARRVLLDRSREVGVDEGVHLLLVGAGIGLEDRSIDAAASVRAGTL